MLLSETFFFRFDIEFSFQNFEHMLCSSKVNYVHRLVGFFFNSSFPAPTLQPTWSPWKKRRLNGKGKKKSLPLDDFAKVGEVLQSWAWKLNKPRGKKRKNTNLGYYLFMLLHSVIEKENGREWHFKTKKELEIYSIKINANESHFES